MRYPVTDLISFKLLTGCMLTPSMTKISGGVDKPNKGVVMYSCYQREILAQADGYLIRLCMYTYIIE